MTVYQPYLQPMKVFPLKGCGRDFGLGSRCHVSCAISFNGRPIVLWKLVLSLTLMFLTLFPKHVTIDHTVTLEGGKEISWFSLPPLMPCDRLSCLCIQLTVYSVIFLYSCYVLSSRNLINQESVRYVWYWLYGFLFALHTMNTVFFQGCNKLCENFFFNFYCI